MSIKQSVRALVDAPAGADPLAQQPAVGAKGAERAVGRAGQGGGTGDGTFDEADYTQREYWTTINKTSVDGLFSIQIKPIKSILLQSGTRATFKEPV